MTRAHRTDIKAPAEWVSIDSLTPWDKNPRRNASAVADVAKSIKRFGFGSPILVRDADSVVIAGHTRLLAARSLGLDKVLIRRLDLDPAEARALALADNKLGEIAEWDEALLSEVIQGLDAESVDFDGLGFSDEELAELLGDVSSEDDSAGDSELGDLDFKVIVDCSSEEHQAQMLHKFEMEGLECRPLIS